MVLKPGEEGVAEAIFRKWELDFAVIGQLTESGRMVLTWDGDDRRRRADPAIGRRVARIRPPLGGDRHRQPALDQASLPPLGDWQSVLSQAAGGSPNGSSKRWIWRQYDHSVMGDSMVVNGVGPGGDSALVRIHGTARALALTSDCTPRYCQANPFEGGKQAVAEAYRNLIAVGAKPLAITDN